MGLRPGVGGPASRGWWTKTFVVVESRDVWGAKFLCDANLNKIFLTNFLAMRLQRFQKHCQQGMVDGSASKPALRQYTGYMVEKTSYDIAPYLGAFGAYLMPQ